MYKIFKKRTIKMKWFYRDGMNILENSSITWVEKPTIHKNMVESIVLESGVGSALAKMKPNKTAEPDNTNRDNDRKLLKW